MIKEPLLGKSQEEIAKWAEDNDLPGYLANQITGWLYRTPVSEFNGMSNISKKVREKLAGQFILGVYSPVEVIESADGTKKYLFPCGEGRFVETVYIPEKNRATLCVSTQVGCRMGCRFCMTGRQGFQGNLTAGEIINQIVSVPERDKLTNIVYMGMGEPLDNTDAVLTSLRIITGTWGFGWSPSRITVSTIGIAPGLARFMQESKAHLAVSLHTPFEEERVKMMPAGKSLPLQQIIETIRSYDPGRQRRVSFEYILFKNINDSARHINGLARLLNGIRCRINLIRFHPVPETPYQPSSEDTLEAFRAGLMAKGIPTSVRASRGRDIAAACGMLSSERKMQKNKKAG